MTALLATLLCLQEERIALTVHFIKATQEERGAVDAALKEIEGELRELVPFNRFDIASSAILRYSPTAEHVRTSFSLRDAGRYHLSFTPQQPLGGRIPLQKVSIQESMTLDDITIAQGATLRHPRYWREEIFSCTVEVPDGRLFVLGTVVVEGKGGPTTLVIAVKAAVK